MEPTSTILAVAVGTGLFFAGMEYNRARLEARQYKEQCAKLEEAQRKNLPYKVIDGLENLIAIAHDVKQRIEYQRLETDMADTRIDHMLEDLKELRVNPARYNPEKPNKKISTR